MGITAASRGGESFSAIDLLSVFLPSETLFVGEDETTTYLGGSQRTTRELIRKLRVFGFTSFIVMVWTPDRNCLGWIEGDPLS